MTVCVAAISANGTIVGAADRMVSIGHLESEPNRSKIYHANDYPITFLYAGGLSLFAKVTHAAFAKVAASPERFKRVGDFADLYADTCSEILAREAERLYLRSRGFTLEELNRNSPPVVPDEERTALLNLVLSYEPDAPLEVLIVGHNITDGLPQLWRVVNRHVECLDTDGYAAIGIGYEEAENHFRLTGYMRKDADFGTAVLTTYIAKCRGERAAGVGHATDMFVRITGPTPPGKVTQNGIKTLRRLYKQLRARERKVNRMAVEHMQLILEHDARKGSNAGMLEAITQQPDQPPEAAQQSPPESTHDQ